MEPTGAVRVHRCASGDISGGRRGTSPGASLKNFDIVVAAVDAGDTGGWLVGRTDAEGRFTADLDRGVRYRLRAQSRDRRSERLEFVAGDALLTLRLSP